MGILRRIAGDLPAQTSGPPVVAGEGTDPAPENTDNSDIVVKAGGASLFERGRGKRPLVTKAVIAAFAVIVLWGARYIMSGRLISDLKTSKLGLEDVSQQPVENVSQQSLDDVSQPSPDDASEQPIDDVSMQKYIKDFNEAAKEMERAFPSESSVRQAFQLHFTPSLEDGQNLPGDPLAVIKDHVAKMEKCEIPSASSPQARLDFVQHLQLLRSICRTVALRFKELELFDSLNQHLGVANPFLVSGGDEDYSDSHAPIDNEIVKEDDWAASGDEDYSNSDAPIDNEIVKEDDWAASGDEDYSDIDAPIDNEIVKEDDWAASGDEDYSNSDAPIDNEIVKEDDWAASGDEDYSDSDAPIDNDIVKEDDWAASGDEDYSDSDAPIDNDIAKEDDWAASGDEDYSDIDAPIDHEIVKEDDWAASDFLEFFGLFGGGRGRVNKALAKKFTWSLDIENTHNNANVNARYHFKAFLQPFEGNGAFDPAHAPDEHQIPYTGEPFRTGALAEAAAHVFRESDANTNYSFIRKLNRIADNWSNEGVEAALKQQEKENADSVQTRLKTKRELMRQLQSQGIPEDDLVTIALFLL